MWRVKKQMKNQELLLKKIDTDMVLYKIIHERVIENTRRSERQSIQIYISMAALLTFVIAAHNGTDVVALQKISDVIMIYLLPLFCCAAIESVLSIETRQIYMGIFLNKIEVRIRGLFSSQEAFNYDGGVLGYEKYRLEEGHRRDQTTNFDLYLMAMITLLIGISFPLIWIIFFDISNIEIIIFIFEMLILFIVLGKSIRNYVKINRRLREIVMDIVNSLDTI